MITLLAALNFICAGWNTYRFAADTSKSYLAGLAVFNFGIAILCLCTVIVDAIKEKK
jgi:hypothetical protein